MKSNFEANPLLTYEQLSTELRDKAHEMYRGSDMLSYQYEIRGDRIIHRYPLYLGMAAGFVMIDHSKRESGSSLNPIPIPEAGNHTFAVVFNSINAVINAFNRAPETFRMKHSKCEFVSLRELSLSNYVSGVADLSGKF